MTRKGANVAMIEQIEKSLLEIDFASLTRRKFTPSPAAWENQGLYFRCWTVLGWPEKDGYRDMWTVRL